MTSRRDYIEGSRHVMTDNALSDNCYEQLNHGFNGGVVTGSHQEDSERSIESMAGTVLSHYPYEQMDVGFQHEDPVNIRQVPNEQGIDGSGRANQHYETMETAPQYVNAYNTVFDHYDSPRNFHTMTSSGPYEIPRPLTVMVGLSNQDTNVTGQDSSTAGPTQDGMYV